MNEFNKMEEQIKRNGKAIGKILDKLSEVLDIMKVMEKRISVLEKDNDDTEYLNEKELNEYLKSKGYKKI